MRYTTHITTIRLFAIIIASLLLVGCNKEQSTSTPIHYPIILSPSILDQSTQTKYAGGTDFVSGDQISVYSVAWTTATAPVLSIVATENNFHNAKFTRDDKYFNFEITPSVASVGFPPNGSSIDIYGIYPYNENPIISVTEHIVNTPVDQSTQQKMIAGDFLVAKKSKVAPQLQPINLDFNHMMAKLHVNITVAEDYIDKNISVTSVKFIAGTEAKINISDQLTPIPATIVASDITPFVTAKTNAAQGCFAEAILAPQKFNADVSCIEVTMSNAKTHVFSFASDFDLESNTITELTLKVAYGASIALTIGEAKITDWATGTEINPDNPVNQNSQNKFSITAFGDKTAAATVKYAAVSIKTANDEGRTYELPATYDATNGIINFEFRGSGNRPNVYPFTIVGIKYFNASWTLVATSPSYTLDISAANQNITQSQTF